MLNCAGVFWYFLRNFFSCWMKTSVVSCYAGYLAFFQKQQQNKQQFIAVCVVVHKQSASARVASFSVCLVTLVMAGHTLLAHVVCGLVVQAMPVWLYLSSNINIKLCIWLPWWSALFSLPHYFILYLGSNYYPWFWNNVSTVVLFNISRLLFNEKST